MAFRTFGGGFTFYLFFIYFLFYFIFAPSSFVGQAVLQTAGLAALAADTEAATIGAAHIDHALGRVKASVSFAMLNDLAAFAEGGGGGAGPSSA